MMAGKLKQKHKLNVARFDQLLRANVWTLKDLASKSGLTIRTLIRKRNGEPAHPATIQLIARALATTPRDLVADADCHVPSLPQEPPRRFKARIKLSGMFHSTQQREFLIRLNTQIMSALAQEGIQLTGQAFAVATSHIAGTGALRMVVAVQGTSDDHPSWFLAAIKPNMLSALCDANEITAMEFPFGEIIVAGWGATIPKSAFRSASQLLGCKPSQILTAADL